MLRDSKDCQALVLPCNVRLRWAVIVSRGCCWRLRLQREVVQDWVGLPAGGQGLTVLVEGGCVEFRLLYSGNQLVSNGSPTVKHAIRRVFHPQLRQLWKTNTRLSRMAQLRGIYTLPPGTDADVEGKEVVITKAQDGFFATMGERYQRGAFKFVPLVEQSLGLRVSIDILFLRRDQHPLIKEGGDLDNRLKTLFDALRVPETTDGLGGIPEAGEEPFFVFLQDDCLVSEIRVNTDNLLMLPQQKAPDAKDAFLVIDVRLKPTESASHSWAFE
jgi:hypothetical protein